MKKFAVALLGLALGSTLGAARAEAACGTFEVAKGDIKVQSAGRVVPVSTGGKICSGDTVIAAADSRAKIKMADGNELNISPDSKIVIEDYQYDKGDNKKKVLLNILKGKVRATTREENMYNDKAKDGQANTFQIRTKSAVAGVRGTDFLTGFDPSTNKTSVVTFRGKVEFGQAGKDGSITNSVQVGAGQKTEQRAGQAPEPPKPVPPSELKSLNAETKADTSTGSDDKGVSSEKKEEKKDDDKKDEKKDEAKKEEAKKEEPKKEEAKSEEKKDDGKKADAKADDKKSDAKTDDKKADAKSEEKKSDVKTDDKKADAKSDDKKSGAKQEVAGGDKKSDTAKSEGNKGGNSEANRQDGKNANAGNSGDNRKDSGSTSGGGGTSGGAAVAGPSAGSDGGSKSTGPASGTTGGSMAGSPGGNRMPAATTGGATGGTAPSPGSMINMGDLQGGKTFEPPKLPNMPGLSVPVLPVVTQPSVPVCDYCQTQQQNTKANLNITITIQQ